MWGVPGSIGKTMDKADERRFLLTFVSIILLAVLFAAVAHAWPEIMPWHRPNARHIP